MFLIRNAILIFAIVLCSLAGFLGILRQKPSGAYRIAFVSFLGNSSTIMTMLPDGSELHVAAERKEWVHRGSPNWTPDAQALAYTESVEGEELIRIMQSQVSHPKPNVLLEPSGGATSSLWSPDGQHLLFLHILKQPTIGLWDHENITFLTTSTEATYFYSPRWSPNSRQIAFVKQTPAKAEIYRINIDGTALELLVSAEIYPVLQGFSFQNIEWSPDGQWLAFEAFDMSENYTRIYLISIDDKSLKHYPNNDQQFLPHWSSDSQWLTFHNGNFPAIVYRMRVADGYTQQLRLSSHPLSGVVWSPDGQWLYYSENSNNGNWDIYRSRPDGTGRQRLTNEFTGDVQPVTSPNIDYTWHWEWLGVFAGLCGAIGGYLSLKRTRFAIARS